jgi:hypothetical protein
MHVFLLILRIAVLLLSIIGSAASGIIGALWWVDKNRTVRMIEQTRKDPSLGLTSSLSQYSTPEDMEREVNRRANAFPVLLVGAPLCLLGGILAVLGRTNSGGGLLLLAGVSPGTLHPHALVFTWPLILAGLLACLVSLLALLTGAWSEQAEGSGRRRGRKHSSQQGKG